MDDSIRRIVTPPATAPPALRRAGQRRRRDARSFDEELGERSDHEEERPPADPAPEGGHEGEPRRGCPEDDDTGSIVDVVG